jgi:uncharacterized repeat protein (TIGR01451 family)
VSTMAEKRSSFRSRTVVAACVMATILLLLAGATAQTCGLPGNDGPGGTISGILNTYFPPASTAVTVNAGATSIALGTATATGASTPIAIGDLVLIIQMQDATINSTNTSSYGDGTAGTGSGYTSATAGRYEFAIATSAVPIAGGTLTVSAGLTNTYTAAAATTNAGVKQFQVVRVPQYSSATLGSVQAAPWNGATGGVAALDVAGALTLGGGSIDVSGRGFRGGGGLDQNGGTGTNAYYRQASTSGDGGTKGEGIAGTPRYVYNSTTGSVIDYTTEGYPNGAFDRGAPGNAGGGGTDGDPSANDENSGGGGGGNGGAGGLGGNSWNSNLVVGGVGGATFPGTALLTVMGGGGGSGTANNQTGGYQTSGAAGGGIVIVRAGTVSGSGTINANGATALDIDMDGAGGGGAGGSVIVTVKTGTLSGLTITANGGNGGNAWINTAGAVNAHGPGGGGGGGVVYQSGGATVSVAGGAHGVTTTGLLTYGSASGSSGISSTTASSALPGASSGAQCIPVLTVTKSTSTASVLQGAIATYTITVKNAAGVAAAQKVNISDPLPQPIASGFSFASTGAVTLSNGATRATTTNPAVGDTTPNWGVFTIPASGQVVITFTVNVAYLVPAATYQNSATGTYLDPTRTTSAGTTSSSYNSGSSTAEDVTVSASVPISGNVYVDTNHNGTFATGESWTSGVAVYINLVSAGVVKQSIQVPAGTGAYSFSSVIPGAYTIVLTSTASSTTVTIPAGWTATSPSSGSLSLTTGTTALVSQNFGLFAGSKLTGSVFIDNGVGGGTANDGKLNGTEKPLASVSVAATNGSSTTYDSAVTDGAGAFALWIPSTATTVSIVETQPLGYLATGGDVGTTAGTYTRATTTIAFTYSSAVTYSGVRFGQVPLNTFAPDNALSGMPGTILLYTHTFSALSAGQVTFSTTAVSGTPNRFTEVLYRDAGCNGILNAADTQVTAAIAVNAGDTVCIIVKEMIAANAPYDAVNSISVQAQFVYTNASPALNATYTHTDVTTVGNSTSSGLRLVKSVDKATAKSGDTLLYTINYSNSGSGTVSNIVVSDTTPYYTTFVSGACGSLPTGITACTISTQPSVGGTGSISWTLTGSLASSASGQVTFTVKIQ